MDEDYVVGELVWAKMKGFPWWPSKIGIPKPEVKKPVEKKPMHFVEFFGSKTYAWISDDFIEPFEKNKEVHSACRLPAFKAAMEEVVETSYKAKLFSIKPNGITPKIKLLPAGYIKNAIASNHRKSESIVRTPKRPLKRMSLDLTSKSPVPHKIPVTGKRSLRKSSTSQLSGSQNNIFCTTSEEQTEPAEKFPSELLNLKIGFIGLGNIGSVIVKNLVNCGYKVTVWNRSPEKISAFRDTNVDVGRTPADVVAVSDITFSCVSDSIAAKKVVSGILKEIRDGKSYIEMTSIDSCTSRDIAEAIAKRDGQYLEASLFGSRELAQDGQLMIFAAGAKELYDKCKKCFQAIGQHSFFLGEVGNASRMNNIFTMLFATTLVSLGEAMSFAEKLNVSHSVLLEIIKSASHHPLHCPFFISKSKEIIEQISTDVPLQHIQKVLQLALQLGKQNMQPLPVTVAANKVFKQAESAAYGCFDISALYRACFGIKSATHTIL